MEKLKTVHIYTVIEARVPQMTQTRSLHLGLAGSKIMDNFKLIEDAEILTWWVEDVRACNSKYVTCPKCDKVELVSSDAVILDGKPLCIHCSADFHHGDSPRQRTREETQAQLKEIGHA